MKWIYDLSYDEFKEEILALNFQHYVADQVFQWLYAKNKLDMSLWSNVGKNNKITLAEHFDFSLNTILAESSDGEGTRKFLLQLHDNAKIETVLITEKDHYTGCISTQVGCPLGCRFCATGRLGFKRNLSSGEILGQVLHLRQSLGDYKGQLNLVFMGMGEPLLNYLNLKKALDIITCSNWLALSPRHITVSTAGILEKIKQFDADFPGMKLSFSLNAIDSAMREELMPISKTEKMTTLLKYIQSSHRKCRVTFEDVLLKDINDSLTHAQKLADLLKNIPCKINLIPYNENEAIPFQRPAKETVEAFGNYLFSRNYTVIIRWSKGRDIRSACGQLAANYD